MLLFINSLYYGYPIPNFIIYKIARPEGTQLYECVDGQHRLTTIKYFLENKIIESNGKRYLHIKDDDKKEILFYKLTPEIKELYKKKYTYTIREFNPVEKDNFENIELSFNIIKSELSPGQKSDIFYRLQQGERVDQLTKLKNSVDYPITNFLKENNNINNIVEELKYVKYDEIKKNTTDYKKIIAFIRMLIIIRKKNLETNYLDLNIRKYIENNSQSVRMTKDEIIQYYDKFKKFNTHIKQCCETKNIKIIPELYYILICLYSNHESKINMINKNFIALINIIKTFQEFNNSLSYKKSSNAVVSIDEITKQYNKFQNAIIVNQ
jgi:hypothetical protein